MGPFRFTHLECLGFRPSRVPPTAFLGLDLLRCKVTPLDDERAYVRLSGPQLEDRVMVRSVYPTRGLVSGSSLT